MNRNLVKVSAASFALVVLAAFVLPGAIPISGFPLETFDSPIVTPVPGPTPTPVMPEESQRALKYIAEREGIPIEQLVVVNQHRRDYELLGRVFWAVTLLDTKSDRWYNVMIVYARFWEPSPHWEVQMQETSPYHLVRVRKDDGVIQEAKLVLQSQALTPTPPSR